MLTEPRELGPVTADERGVGRAAGAPVTPDVMVRAFDAGASPEEIVASLFTTSLDSPHAVPAWLTPTIQKLSELLQLPPNWSSYRASPVRSELAAALLSLLVEVMGDDTPAPTVVPTASGGLQAEWHRNGYDLEIEVSSPSRLVADFGEIETGKVESRSVISDLRPLVEWINAVSA